MCVSDYLIQLLRLHVFVRHFALSILFLPTMELVCPGSTTTALALATPVAASGRGKLDPRFFAILTQAGVRESDMDKLGDGDCTTVGIFARIGLDDKGLAK